MNNPFKEFEDSLVDGIWEELKGRQGVGDELERCDDEIQDEIKESWRKVVKASFEQFLKGRVWDCVNRLQSAGIFGKDWRSGPISFKEQGDESKAET